MLRYPTFVEIAPKIIQNCFEVIQAVNEGKISDESITDKEISMLFSVLGAFASCKNLDVN